MPQDEDTKNLDEDTKNLFNFRFKFSVIINKLLMVTMTSFLLDHY